MVTGAHGIGLDYGDFDCYCDEHEIQPGEEPAAFAAWLHEISGGKWDGDVRRLPPDVEKLARAQLERS